jgi:16S rRNA (guanine(966)-N(2))-methyltransferase RsmD
MGRFQKGSLVEKTEVRIVAGTLKGRKVTCFVHEGMRPTPQMVREALFSILGNAVPDRVFYDIFAGTGVVGLEAVSRGAREARLIEGNAKQAAEIQKYVDKFGVASQVQVLKVDAYRWAERWMATGSQPVNLFFSPPFPDLVPPKLQAFLTMVQQFFDKAPPESVLIIQAEDGFPVDDLPDLDRWDIRKYGRNLLLFRVKDAPEPAGESALA